MAEPAPALTRKSSSIIARRSPVEYIVALVFGIQEPYDIHSQCKLWETVGILSALLLAVSAGGMYTAGTMVHADSNEGIQGGKVLVGEATVIVHCITTFCFLTSAVTSAFFREFALSSNRDIDDIMDVLGWTFWTPMVYFRLGYYTLVASLCFFFHMIMDIRKTGACLGACGVGLIVPMFIGMGRAMSKFEEQKGRAESRKKAKAEKAAKQALESQSPLAA